MKKTIQELNQTKNRNRTKEEIISKVNEIQESQGDIILIESNKRRVNISLNDGILREVEKLCKNKSNLIEELLKEWLEEKLGKSIRVTKLKSDPYF